MDNYKIDHVAKLTGLSKHVIRSWERRFNLLRPERGGNRYRIYSQEDIDLLYFIRQQLDAGFAIGELASSGRDYLISQMRDKNSKLASSSESPLDRINNGLLNSLRPFDRAKFVSGLNEAISLFPFDQVFYKIFIPVQRKVGDLWHDGKIGVGEEHFVTHHIRQKFFSALNQLPVPDEGPKVVITCLPNDYHELGAWIAAYQCATNGCQMFYLGANMPVHDLGEFCKTIRPGLVLLSCSRDLNETEAKSLAEEYRKTVLPICPIWAGGSLMDSMGSHFRENEIEVLDSLNVLEERIKLLQVF